MIEPIASSSAERARACGEHAHERAARAVAREVHALGAGDRAHGVDRLERAVRVGVQPPVAVLGVRVAPGEREHLLALAHQVLDHAALGREVDEVVLVDHRRHDQQRLLAHRRRLRRVPDQLEQLGAHDDRAGRGRDVDADLEPRRVDARRQPRRRGHVAGEVARAAHEVGAALLAPSRAARPGWSAGSCSARAASCTFSSAKRTRRSSCSSSRASLSRPSSVSPAAR